MLHVSPDLQVGLATNAQHLFAFELQLLGECADGLVQRVDLAVQVHDAFLPAGHLLLQVRDLPEQLLLLPSAPECSTRAEQMRHNHTIITKTHILCLTLLRPVAHSFHRRMTECPNLSANKRSGGAQSSVHRLI